MQFLKKVSLFICYLVMLTSAAAHAESVRFGPTLSFMNGQPSFVDFDSSNKDLGVASGSSENLYGEGFVLEASVQFSFVGGDRKFENLEGILRVVCEDSRNDFEPTEHSIVMNSGVASDVMTALAEFSGLSEVELDHEYTLYMGDFSADSFNSFQRTKGSKFFLHVVGAYCEYFNNRAS